MKFTKKCDSTQNKISINNNKRRSSAGMFYTSSAGAVTSLILMRKHSTSIAALIFIITLSFIFGFTGATNLFGLNGSAFAADNISLTVDTNNLAINLATLSSTGDFAKSGNMNIGVSTTSTSGYTLSIASSTGSTDLTNQSDNTKKINSLASAISESDFSSSTNTQYNNKWGYKPSQYVTMNGDTPVIHPNTNYRPLPGTNGEIIAKTSVANPTADNYTLSIGARATNTTTKGNYTSDTFILQAVTNFTGLTIIYDGNGLYFDGDPTKTTNEVVYDATTLDVPLTKYSHTPNISDAGVQDGNYLNNLSLNEVITIPGASTIHISFKFGAEDSSDWATIWQGSHPDYTAASNYSSGIQSCGTATSNNGRFDSDSIVGPVECNISGNTVTFGFTSDPGLNNYGYYAVITGLDSSGNPVLTTGYSKSAVAGSYTTPSMNTGATIFKGWSENASDTTPTYTNEAEVSAKLPAVNGDPDVTLYAIYEHADTAMQNMSSSQCTTTGLKVYDNRDNSIYLVKKLADNKCWMLDNLRLDLTNSTILNGLTTSNTHVNSASLTSLKSGNRSAGAQYASSGFAKWDMSNSSSVYNQAKANADNMNGIPSGAPAGGAGSNKVGVYYNYCAASAGSYCYDQNAGTGNASYDLCPAGWRMPTGGSSGEYQALYTAYSSNPTNFKNALSTPLSGSFYGGYASSQGTNGSFWSSTYGGGYTMYNLNVYSSYVNLAGNINRYNGYSVRCVKEKYMQEVDQWKDELTVGEQVKAVDNRDGKEYWVAKQADGNIWMTQNLDLDIGGTNTAALTSDNTDLNTSGSGIYVDGYDNSTGVIIWTPDNTAKTSNHVISGTTVPDWASDNNEPYSAEGGDNYYYTTGTTSNETAQTLAQCTASHTEGECKHYHVGNYYNWTAAIASNASSGIGPTRYDVAANSICPKGWKLPQGRSSTAGDAATRQFGNLWYTSGIITSVSGSSYATDGFNKIRTSPLFFVRGGYVSGGSLSGSGSYGYYWSSSVNSTSYAYSAYFVGSGINSALNSLYRYRGQSLRCMVQ